MYDATPSLFWDAGVTVISACFGNAFPPCIYIGHPAIKSMGARVSYLYLNAIFVAIIGFFNLTALIMQAAPIVCTVGFLMCVKAITC